MIDRRQFMHASAADAGVFGLGLGTSGTYDRAISEAAARQVGSDIVSTSAMGLQMGLVRTGFAEACKSPEAAKLPTGHMARPRGLRKSPCSGCRPEWRGPCSPG